jgi:hypothetical protein
MEGLAARRLVKGNIEAARELNRWHFFDARDDREVQFSDRQKFLK